MLRSVKKWHETVIPADMPAWRAMSVIFLVLLSTALLCLATKFIWIIFPVYIWTKISMYIVFFSRKKRQSMTLIDWAELALVLWAIAMWVNGFQSNMWILSAGIILLALAIGVEIYQRTKK
jgi:hypothetical protein